MSNARFPHIIKIYRKTSNTNPFVDDDAETVLYEGYGRSFSTSRTSSEGDVIVSQRVVAIGHILDPTMIMETIRTGDYIIITNGARVEYGRIIDIQSSNFGTDIFWEYGRT